LRYPTQSGWSYSILQQLAESLSSKARKVTTLVSVDYSVYNIKEELLDAIEQVENLLKLYLNAFLAESQASGTKNNY
jgi:hypothetical protein